MDPAVWFPTIIILMVVGVFVIFDILGSPIQK
ncbi:hypothetical protein SAMN06264868_11715 [Venenivibrio stagnispumantis]|uniref:Uncharacterized protein n=1 Tax=Venenivibrio stagnispumantis TaxID=407998 RepID=A0AA45WNE1_9AQUI|nr:hypothetical protein SAMN06264868_11715 [Venenivibrio stagnispumantis]